MEEKFSRRVEAPLYAPSRRCSLPISGWRQHRVANNMLKLQPPFHPFFSPHNYFKSLNTCTIADQNFDLLDDVSLRPRQPRTCSSASPASHPIIRPRSARVRAHIMQVKTSLLSRGVGESTHPSSHYSSIPRSFRRGALEAGVRFSTGRRSGTSELSCHLANECVYFSSLSDLLLSRLPLLQLLAHLSFCNKLS